MKKTFLKTVFVATLASLTAIMSVSQTANAVVISSTKASPIDNRTYLQNSILNRFVVNSSILSASFTPAQNQFYPFRQVQGQFAQFHYDRVKINRGSEHAEKVLEFYLSVLDPNKIYFTQQDVDGFKSQFTRGSTPKLTNDLNIAWQIYRVYVQRATEINRAQAAYILSLKDKQPNLDTNGVLALGEKASYRNANRKSVDELARELALSRLISIKLEKTTFSWSEICAYAIRGLVNFQSILNNTSNSDVFGLFMNSYTVGGADYHSKFFPAERQSDFADGLSRSFVGIGVSFKGNTDGTFEIVSVLPGGPSAKQGGIEKGDEILAVSNDNRNWTSVEGLSQDRVVRLIRGQRNTKVFLRLLSSNGYTKVVSIVRGEVEKQDETAKLETYRVGGKKYGVLSFGMFYTGVANDIRKLIEDNRDIAGLIIDLRNNGGGLVDELLRMSELFFGPYAPIFQVTSSPSQVVGNVKLSSTYDFNNRASLFTKPIIVLINGYSASASEILGAAIQDYKRGIVVGSTSYGKGTVQEPRPISDFSNDGISIITIQKFFRLTGGATQFNGVTPDVNITAIPAAADSERTGFNPLPYSVINETRFTAFTDYVKPAYIQQLKDLEQNWSKTNKEYRDYTNFILRVQKENEAKVSYINYSRRLDYQKFYERESLNRYNSWAKANGKKTYPNYRAFTNADVTTGPDPVLDLVKQMLVTYTNNFRN